VLAVQSVSPLLGTRPRAMYSRSWISRAPNTGPGAPRETDDRRSALPPQLPSPLPRRALRSALCSARAGDEIACTIAGATETPPRLCGQQLAPTPSGAPAAASALKPAEKRWCAAKERKDWEVLIPNHHEGYLSWADYERILSLIADNANGKNPMSRGALRRGEALLAGLLRCGHCGRKLHVAYSGIDGNTGRYHCQGGFINHGGDRCISFGGMRIDRDIGAEVIARLQPLGIEAALAAQAVRSPGSEDKRRQVELALEQARYEVGRSRRQYFDR
jgi:hypothetical protein